jgi:hypothetical protein
MCRVSNLNEEHGGSVDCSQLGGPGDFMNPWQQKRKRCLRGAVPKMILQVGSIPFSPKTDDAKALMV